MNTFNYECHYDSMHDDTNLVKSAIETLQVLTELTSCTTENYN